MEKHSEKDPYSLTDITEIGVIRYQTCHCDSPRLCKQHRRIYCLTIHCLSEVLSVILSSLSVILQGLGFLIWSEMVNITYSTFKASQEAIITLKCIGFPLYPIVMWKSKTLFDVKWSWSLLVAEISVHIAVLIIIQMSMDLITAILNQTGITKWLESNRVYLLLLPYVRDMEIRLTTQFLFFNHAEGRPFVRTDCIFIVITRFWPACVLVNILVSIVKNHTTILQFCSVRKPERPTTGANE